jgi:type III secretory pathway component EscV
MLVQLLLCIGLPFLILPILATIAYCGFRWIKAKKKKSVVKDVEHGDFVVSSTKEDSDEDKSVGSQQELSPALVSNSVQIPVAFSRNF